LDVDGRERENLIEWEEGRGMATGLVTNTRLTHATPAAFATHQISRYVDEQNIAQDMLTSNDIKVLLGGGARAFVPQGTHVAESLPGIPAELDGPSRRKDDVSLIEEARQRGYAIADDRKSLNEAKSGSDKVLGLFAASHLPYEIDRSSGAFDQVPSLEMLTESALEVLERSDKGFFLLVEGGRIDHAGHDNDAGTMLREILEFDNALDVGLRFQKDHPETLVIVTADHATGGFAFTYSWRPEPLEVALPSGETYLRRWYYPGKNELEILGRQTASYETILGEAGSDVDRLIEEVERRTGLVLTKAEAEQTLSRDTQGHAVPRDFSEFYADYESAPQAMLGRALARQTSVVWSSGGHTSDPVMTFGIGPGSEGLQGVYLNRKIYEVIKKALESNAN
jgi:alkaline phosphatase